VGGCSQAGCCRRGRYRPLFVLYFTGERIPRRIDVPFAVCEEHATEIGRAMASPARRMSLERAAASPLSPGLDWRRCRVEFVGSGGAAPGPSGSAGWPA
jgi:hypothetical protein